MIATAGTTALATIAIIEIMSVNDAWAITAEMIDASATGIAGVAGSTADAPNGLRFRVNNGKI